MWRGGALKWEGSYPLDEVLTILKKNGKGFYLLIVHVHIIRLHNFILFTLVSMFASLLEEKGFYALVCVFM